MKNHRPKTKSHFLSGLGAVSPWGAPVEGLETRWLFAAGLIGQYYGDTSLTKLDLTRTDATVNFQWGMGAPDPSVPADTFSVRWTGQIAPTSSRSYTFSVLTDGGTRLYVNNQLVINHWSVSTSGQVSYASSSVSLSAGKQYNIRLEFFSTTGPADIAVRWQSSVMPLSVIPTGNLSTTYVDTTAPSTPTGLGASGTTSTKTTLSWTASTDDVGVTSYDVFRNNVKIASTTTPSYTDSGLSPNTSYSYKVDARDAAGNVSSASSTVSTKTLAADTTAPTAPTGLSVTNATMTAISLAWNASTDNVGVVRYDIYRNGVKVGSSTTTSYTDSGLTLATSYTYTVTAADAAGNISVASSPLVAKTAADTTAPSVPTGLIETSATFTTLGLAWTASTDNVGVVRYDVYRNGVKVGSSTTTSYTDSGLTLATSYTYTVTAADAAGNISVASSPLVAATAADTTAPSVPTGLAVSNLTYNSLTLSWSAATDNVGVTAYDVFRNGTKIGSTSSLSFPDSGLSGSSSYTYTVDARDAAGNVSAISAPRAVNTPAQPDTQPPSVPTGLVETTATLNTITLTWTASTDNVGVVRYDVYRNGTKIGSSATATYADSGLSPGTSYDYTVTAADAAGNVSAPSAVFPATTAADTTPPSVPTGLAVSNLTFSSLTLSWSAATDDVGVTSYDVFRNGTNIGSTSGLSIADAGLSGSTSYSYTVDARDAAGNVSAASTALVIVTPPAPDTQPPTSPTGLGVANSTATTLTIGWNAATDNVGVVLYAVYRNGVQVGTSNTLSYADSGLAPSTSYTYTVTAADAAGNVSIPSDPLSAITAADTQAPTSPTGLSASNVTYKSLKLSWLPATDDVGVTLYDVYRDNAYIGSTSGLSLTDSSLSAGTSYTYTVDAQDAAGNISPVSQGFLVTTSAPPDTQPPDAPTGLNQTNATDTTLSLAWNPANDNVGVVGYDVYRNGVEIGSTFTPGFTDSGLSPSTSYTYTVTALDAANNVSAASDPFVASTVPDTQAPTVPQGLSASNVTYSSLTLSWSAATDDVGVTSYDVFRDGMYLASTSGLSFSDSGLSGSTPYTYTVDAQDAAGNVSVASTPFVITTPAPPDTQPPTAPTGLTETGSTMTTLTIGWTASTDDVGVVGYEVYRNGIAIGPSAMTSYTDIGLSPGASYTYTVTASDAAENVSPASTPFVASTAPDTQPPSVPAGLKVVSTTSNSVSLSWSAATDNVAVTGYDVFRNGVNIGSPTSTSYTDTGLAAGSSYTYTVDAHDAAGNASAVSSPVTGTTTAAFTTWYVDASGKTPGSTTTIAAAYAKANPGDVVLVEPGTYKESLNLTRSGTATAPITLQAATVGTAILDGGSSLNTAIYGTATYIDIVGLTVQHYKSTGYQNEQAAIRTASGWILSNDTVQLNSGTGIGVFGNGISLTGVISQNNGVNGIGGSAATNVILTNCTSQGNNTGVYFTNHDPTDEGGGGKWANCNGLTFINYHGDNNCGPGLWLDWENSNVTLTNCEGSGNHGGGPTNAPDWVGAPVMIEANYGPVNVTNFTGAYSNSGPFSIFETPNVNVTQSTLLSGLSFRTLNRGVAALVDNNDVVTHNTILYVDLNGSAPTNLTLDYNNYQAATGYAFFYWTNNSSYTTLAALQAATKFELHGTLVYVTYP